MIYDLQPDPESLWEQRQLWYHNGLFDARHGKPKVTNVFPFWLQFMPMYEAGYADGSFWFYPPSRTW